MKNNNKDVRESHSTSAEQKHDSVGDTAVTGLRVLVVDDNEASAKMLGWALELQGHEVWIAHDGANALAMALDFKPQAVLLDIALPGLNGYELCRIMRTEYGFEGTLFIAQTGWRGEEYRQRSQEAGFAHHLVKPVDLGRLEELLIAHQEKLESARD